MPSPQAARLLVVALGDAIIVVSVVILVEFHAGVILAFKQIVGDAHPLYRLDE